MHGDFKTHDFKASLGKGISNDRVIVRDGKGQEVAVLFQSTDNNIIAHGYIDGVGFIGGWRANSKHHYFDFRAIVDYINQGVLYDDTKGLPVRTIREDKEFRKQMDRSNKEVSDGDEVHAGSA